MKFNRGSTRSEITIREEKDGSINLYGLTEEKVQYLEYLDKINKGVLLNIYKETSHKIV